MSEATTKTGRDHSSGSHRGTSAAHARDRVWTRRAFSRMLIAGGLAPGLLRSTTAADTPALDRIQVGVVGLGSRGFNLLDALLAHPECQIVAVCDVDRLHHRDQPWGRGRTFGLTAAQKHVEAAYAKSKSGTPARGLQTCRDFRELTARADIDAVVVATPDHWHALCTLEALRAGKDVYCEKPVTHLFAEGQEVVNTVAQHGRIFQTGSQQRSDAKFRRAVDLVRNGQLGKIERIEVGLPPGYSEPQGDTTVVSPRPELDYNFWCGPSEVLPLMQARHHRWWRGHRAYGGGVLMDWIGHHNDIAHWALDTDRRGPLRVQAINWEFPQTDIYNTPEHYTIRCEYADDVISTISTHNREGLTITGSEGWLWVSRGKMETSHPDWQRAGFKPGPLSVQVSDDHMGNFLQCVRSRAECIAPAAVGHRSITPGHLGYVSQHFGRTLEWDAVAERIVDDPEADAMLRSLHYRAPWSIT